MMSYPKTRPGNPERGWNDPPMFNFSPGVQPTAPRRTLNKRVAFPASTPSQPGHAVSSPGSGPPILNPVLSGSVLSQPEVKPPRVLIGPKDTPLGNQAPPISPVQILPPSSDASAPQAVPLLVPGLIPAAPPLSKDRAPQVGIESERLEELYSRLSLSDETLLEYNLNLLQAEIDKYKSILTVKVCDDISKKLGLIKEKWKRRGFSEIVKVRLTQLAEALSKEETDKANQLHLALMVDHISEVNQWMMGVKRLIQQQQLACKERELLSDKSDNTDLTNKEDEVKGGNCGKELDNKGGSKEIQAGKQDASQDANEKGDLNKEIDDDHEVTKEGQDGS